MVSICRLCASLKKSENLTFIRDNNHPVWLKLAKCCQLRIDLKDVLPKGVCPECVRNLNASFEFYERVHESQQSLEKLLNVDTASSKEMVIDSEPSSEDRDSLALIAAAIDKPQTEQVPKLEPEEENENETENVIVNENENQNEPENDNEIVNANEDDDDDDSDDVTRVINEILGGGGGDHVAYLIQDSDTLDEPPKPETPTEKRPEDEATVPGSEVTDELQNIPEGILLPGGNYAGIEFIDDDEEEIDFEHHQYEIIEEEDGEDDEQMEDNLQNVSMYEIEGLEDSESREELPKPNIPLPTANDTWTEYPWKCVRCLIECTSSKHLIEHNEKIHEISNSNVQWYCADCQKIYPRYYTLINHIRQRHRTNLSLLCDICNEACKSFTDLEGHRRKLHMDEQIPVIHLCVECGKGFSSKNSLQIHSKCHLPDDQRLRYACDLCDKKFRTSSNLKFHQKMHSGTRDYICDQCGKNFVQRANLEEHLVTHITYTPYVCSLCNKFFKTPERLTRHKQRHTDTKPFTCSECDKRFRTKDAMTTHMRIHTGEMPFSCEFCDKPFRFRSTLMTHHNVHTGTRPYSCVDCDHHFTNWPNYNKHMKRRHGIDVSSKNPRGKKPAIPRKPLPIPKRSASATAVTKSTMKREVTEDIRTEEEEEDVDDMAAEYEAEEEINITLPKQEKDKSDDNYEDAI